MILLLFPFFSFVRMYPVRFLEFQGSDFLSKILEELLYFVGVFKQGYWFALSLLIRFCGETLPYSRQE